MNIKAIALDFDGVIVESVGIKDQAFEELFKEYPQHLDKILAYHRSNNATIRFDKFRYIFEEILKKPFGSEDKKVFKEKFSQLIFQKIVECPFVSGALAFLKECSAKAPLYLVSINPLDELNRILEARDIKKYFNGIYAYPWLKNDALIDIMQKEGLSIKQLVFIGDSLEDYKASHGAGVAFIGREHRKEFTGINIPVFPDMQGIKNYINTLETPRASLKE